MSDDSNNLRVLNTVGTDIGYHPNQVLAEVLGYCASGIPNEKGEAVAEVEAVVVVYRGDDGLLDLNWSTMSTGDLCELAMYFTSRAMDVVAGRDACEALEPEPEPESSAS